MAFTSDTIVPYILQKRSAQQREPEHNVVTILPFIQFEWSNL